MENLKLRRPLAFIDLESTGTSPFSDRIVEIAILKINPDGGEDFRCKRVNPGVPIPAEATAIHGITNADVANEPPFAAYARSLSEFLADCDIAGFNVAGFNLPMLEAEFRRAGIPFSWEGRAVIDAMAIFHQKERRDLAAAVRFYCGRDFPEAHSSEDDVRAAADVLQAQLERYDDLLPAGGRGTGPGASSRRVRRRLGCIIGDGKGGVAMTTRRLLAFGIAFLILAWAGSAGIA